MKKPNNKEVFQSVFHENDLSAGQSSVFSLNEEIKRKKNPIIVFFCADNNCLVNF